MSQSQRLIAAAVIQVVAGLVIFADSLAATTAVDSGSLVLAELRLDGREAEYWLASTQLPPYRGLALSPSDQSLEGSPGRDSWGLHFPTRSESMETYGATLGSTLIGTLDRRYLWTLSDPSGLAMTHDITVGPRIDVADDISTQFYYRSSGQGGFGGEMPNIRGLNQATELDAAGLAQVWRFTDGGGQLRLGYEFAHDRTEDLRYVKVGHSLNLSGRFPLRWGLHARMAADYSVNTYPEYEGSSDLVSERWGYSAGLVGSFGARFEGGVHYLHTAEEFDDSVPSYGRRGWGLNLRYIY
ncbi:MAG: hypothetical protein OEU36_11940 [Gammaproteobacteria bacterium]|nr:hypothetical protein [Gammaproteobacteria bacterium]